MRVRDEAKEITIRQKAIEIIVRHGLGALNMKDLAIASGISASTIYVYFKNKEDLILKLCQWLRIEILANSIKGLTADMSLADGLLLQWNNRYRYFINHPLNFEASEQLRYSPLYYKTTPKVIEAIGPKLDPFIKKCRKRGELAEMPFELYWAIAFAPLYQLMEFHISNRSYANAKFRITPALIKKAVGRIVKSLSP